MPLRTAFDPDLINAACAGDTDAIEALLRLYQPTITRFARKYCATPEDVEDAVQETLWIASQKIGTLRVAAAVVSWLFNVVKNECYRLLNGDQDQHDIEQIIESWVVAEANSEREAMLRLDVITALANLPAAYRQVLILRDLKEMTGPEVAASLGLSLETVKSRLHRARDILRQQLVAWNEY